MKGQIDFLKGYKTGSTKKTQFFHFLRVGSFLLILAYCLFVGVIFSYWLFLNRQASNVNLEITNKKQRIEKLKDVESLQVFLKQRLSNLEKFFSSSKDVDFGQILVQIDQIANEIKIKELKMSEGKVNLSGEAPNNLVLEKFIENLKNGSPSLPFSQIKLSSLDRQENGSYLFNLILETKG